MSAIAQRFGQPVLEIPKKTVPLNTSVGQPHGLWRNNTLLTASRQVDIKPIARSLTRPADRAGIGAPFPVRATVGRLSGDAVDLIGITILRDDRLRADGTTLKSKHALIGSVAVLTMVLGVFMMVRRIGAGCCGASRLPFKRLGQSRHAASHAFSHSAARIALG